MPRRKPLAVLKTGVQPMHINVWPIAAVAGIVLVAVPGLAQAKEFYIGEPVTREGMQIVPNYLEGIQMDHMPPGAAMAPGAIHLECDVHATKDEKHGFPEDAWMPYLTIKYTIEKLGGGLKVSGQLWPMTAGDGPHYANQVLLAGPGQYHLTYQFLPPSAQGFIRHVDKATGVPDWWKPFAVDWTFTYPSKAK